MATYPRRRAAARTSIIRPIHINTNPPRRITHVIIACGLLLGGEHLVGGFNAALQEQRRSVRTGEGLKRTTDLLADDADRAGLHDEKMNARIADMRALGIGADIKSAVRLNFTVLCQARRQSRGLLVDRQRLEIVHQVDELVRKFERADIHVGGVDRRCFRTACDLDSRVLRDA